jgi:PAS domain S-box-containing protein
MLQPLSRQRTCREHAAEVRTKANASEDPALKSAFLDAEKRWLTLARHFALSESLDQHDYSPGNAGDGHASDDHGNGALEASAISSLPASAEQVLWSIIENCDDAIITKSLDGILAGWNKAAERMFGYAAEEVIGLPVTILIPEDRHDEEPEILARIRRGERVLYHDTVRRRRDGTLLEVSLTVSPIKNAAGEIIGASKIARDITERKRADQHRTILAGEAEHRTKNILAAVQAVVSLSRSETTDGLKEAIQGRLKALASVHDLLVQSRWKGAELSAIAMRELAPYLGENEAKALIDGPPVWLAADEAQPLAITLHELATNAAKYGALSVPSGRVEVTWLRSGDGELVIHWRETGGPAAKKPTRPGFGTAVIARMIQQQLKGELRSHWRSTGFACEIVLRGNVNSPRNG